MDQVVTALWGWLQAELPAHGFRLQGDLIYLRPGQQYGPCVRVFLEVYQGRQLRWTVLLGGWNNWDARNTTEAGECELCHPQLAARLLAGVVRGLRFKQVTDDAR